MNTINLVHKIVNTINLVNPDISTVKFHIDRFPDGEPQFVIEDEINRKKDYTVICRVASPDDLFLLLEVGDILDRNDVIWDLNITYLMSMRMDRVMDFNRPFSLKIVGRLISEMKYNNCFIHTPHSDRTLKEIRNSQAVEYSPVLFKSHYNMLNTTTVYPDNGAMKRYGTMNNPFESVIFFEKTRDIETGKILSFDLHDENILDNSTDTFMFYDDLCDAGGTFLGELAVLKQKYPNAKYYIRVTHLVNEKGLDNLCQNFDKVFITESYKNWSFAAKAKGYDNLIIDCLS